MGMRLRRTAQGRYSNRTDFTEAAENFVLQTNRKYGCKTIHDHRFGKARGAENVHHRAGGLYQGQL